MESIILTVGPMYLEKLVVYEAEDGKNRVWYHMSEAELSAITRCAENHLGIQPGTLHYSRVPMNITWGRPCLDVIAGEGMGGPMDLAQYLSLGGAMEFGGNFEAILDVAIRRDHTYLNRSYFSMVNTKPCGPMHVRAFMSREEFLEKHGGEETKTKA